MTGYINIHRSIQKSGISKCSRLARLLWVELLLCAAWSDFLSTRGSFKTTTSQLIELMGWDVNRSNKVSRGQIRGALKTLSELSMIITKRSGNELIIDICNYDQYQSFTKPEQAQTKKTNKKQKDEKYEQEHLIFWAEYGCHGVKKSSLKAFMTARKGGVPLNIIMDGVGLYKEHLTINKTESKYVKHASNWIKEESWERDYSTAQKYNKRQAKNDKVTDAISQGRSLLGIMQDEPVQTDRIDRTNVECPEQFRKAAGSN